MRHSSEWRLGGFLPRRVREFDLSGFDTIANVGLLYHSKSMWIKPPLYSTYGTQRSYLLNSN